MSRVLPEAHQAADFGVHPIRGRHIGGRTLQLTEHSRLIIRVDAEHIARFLPLAGKSLRLLDRQIRIGVPQVHSLLPATALRSRLVTIKLPETASQKGDAAKESFSAAIGRQFATLGISIQPKCSLGKRRTLRIKDKEVMGYEVLIESLAAEESLTLQEHGLGGRRKMGCGIFTPFKREGAAP
jgi:CRISPR-associated protein Cas6